ncbi:MAG: radical SAM protein [Pirellulaceae bacterium]|nr:radical SAM protein [Pirellulaceae bacterium]
MSDSTIDSERLHLAQRQYRHCLLCERRCGVDRTRGERGFCGATDVARVYRSRVECGEEIELIPSQLLYLSGCNLRCVFCIGEEDAFDPQRGRPLTGQLLNEAVAAGSARGARNIQWVGGEPTIHLPAILEAVARCGRPLPIVWKSNFFGTIEGLDLLDGIADAYVADLKFGNDSCARQIAGVDGYMRIVTRNLSRVAEKSRLIVRHLLLPGHFECCFRPIVDWLRRNLPTTPLRIMTGYLPRWRAASRRELAAPLARGEGDRAIALAKENGLELIA